MPDDFHQKMTEIAMRQGREPIDGTRIEGFGAADPPPPRLDKIDIASAAEAYGEPVEAPPPPPPPVSPLVELARTRSLPVHRDFTEGEALYRMEVGLSPRGGAEEKEAELWIVNEHACYQGRKVTLTAQEKVQVARLVVRALKRDLATLEVGGSRVRRRKVRSGPSSETTTSPTSPPTSSASSARRPRKPRGSLLNLTKP